MRHPSTLPLPLLALLLACGGPAPELALSGPLTAEVIWGSSTPLELTLERNETANDAVTLSIEGVPDGVTARFEPATVSGDVHTVALHLEARRDAPGGVALVTVHAAGADALVATHVLALEVGGLTVAGSVENLTGEPLVEGLRVTVGSQRVVTDDAGHFVAHEVAVPYDLVVASPLLTEVYLGLTTATPHVRGFLHTVIDAFEETVGLSGTIVPTPAIGERVTVCSSAARAVASSCDVIEGDGARNTYDLTVPLVGGAAESRHLIARREVLDGAGMSSGYDGYAEAAIPYAPGLDRVIHLTLKPSSSSPIAFSLDRGPGDVVQVFGWVSYGAFLNGRSELDPDVMHLPEGAQGSILAISMRDEGMGAITRQPVTGPLEAPITFAPLLPVHSPVSGAILTDDVEFVTGDPDGSLVSHTFAGPDSRVVAVHTFEDRVRFSELAAQVPGLTSDSIRAWYVTTSPQVTSPEQALAHPVGYLPVVLLMEAVGQVPENEPFRMTLSGMRSFPAPASPLGATGPLFEGLGQRLMR